MADSKQDKILERRLRRVARRRGLTLRKNPRRDPRAYDYGSYMLVNESGFAVADFGWDHFEPGDHLAAVEKYLFPDQMRQQAGKDASA